MKFVSNASVDLLSQFVQFGLVDGLGGLLPFGGKFGVGIVEAALSAPLRPILALRNMVALGFQQIDLVQVGLLAHFHDSDTEVPEHGRGAAVLLARFPVARLVHEGLPFHGADAQAADDDVDVDVPGTVVPIRVGADDGGMTGEVVLAELQAEGLRFLHSQPVFGYIPWVETDDILVTFNIFRVIVLVVLSVCKQTGSCKRIIATLKGVDQVRIPQHGPALFVQNYLAGKFIVLVNEVRFDGGVVRIFRGDMLERCHTVHPELSRRGAGMQSGLQVRQGVSPAVVRCLLRQS